MKTFDNIRDTAIRIVDDLVGQGIIKDCLNTDDEMEYDVQDTVIYHLLEAERENILKSYTKDSFTVVDGDLIDNAIGYGVLETDEIREHFKDTMREFYKLFFDNEEEAYEHFMDFDEHYDNGKTHIENWQNFLEFFKSEKV